MDLLLKGGSGELMSFDQVREQLQEKNLNFGQWLQAVLDGELVQRKRGGYAIQDDCFLDADLGGSPASTETGGDR